jgi:hypothetical protein
MHGQTRDGKLHFAISLMHQARCLKKERKEIKVNQTSQQSKIQNSPAETIATKMGVKNK